MWQSMQKTVGELGSRFNNASSNNALAEFFFDEKDA